MGGWDSAWILQATLAAALTAAVVALPQCTSAAALPLAAPQAATAPAARRGPSAGYAGQPQAENTGGRTQQHTVDSEEVSDVIGFEPRGFEPEGVADFPTLAAPRAALDATAPRGAPAAARRALAGHGDTEVPTAAVGSVSESVEGGHGASCLPPPTRAQQAVIDSVRSKSVATRAITLGAVAGDSSANALAASQLAAILLKERFGVEAAVRLVTVRDGHSSFEALQEGISSGDIDVALDMWPNGLALHEVGIEPGGAADQSVLHGYSTSASSPVSVVELNNWARTGRAGWFVPNYVVEQFTFVGREVSLMTPAQRASLQTMYLTGGVLAGPPTWASELACQDGGIFDNLGFSINCTRYDSTDSLLRAVASKVQGRLPFMTYLWEPHVAIADYNLTRLRLPCHASPCFANLTCDYPEVALRKLAHADIALRYPWIVVEAIDAFAVANSVLQDVVHLASGNRSIQGIEYAACSWAKQNPVGLANVSTSERALLLLDVSPRVVSARGGTPLTLFGAGFGSLPSGSIRATVAGKACERTIWVASDELRCVTPAGVGAAVSVTVHVGPESATLDAVLSYEPATLRDIAVGGVRTHARSASAGQTLTILGDNFVQSALLQCRIGGVVSQALYINFSAAECVLPVIKQADGSDASGNVQVEVTNDGDRWRGGLNFHLDASGITWPGNVAGIVPRDNSHATSPSQLTVACMFQHFAPAADDVCQYWAEFINNDSSVLTNTVLTVISPDVTATADASTDVKEAYLRQQVVALQQQYPDLIGIVGQYYSSSSLPLAKAIASLETPIVQVSPASMSYALSDIQAFPYFFRVVPPDNEAAAGITGVILQLEDRLLASGLLHDDRRVGLLMDPTDLWSSSITELTRNEMTRVGITSNPVVEIDASSVGGDVPALKNLMQPLVDTNTRVIVVLFLVQQDTITDAMGDIGLLDDQHLIVSADPNVFGDVPFGIMSFYEKEVLDGEMASYLSEEQVLREVNDFVESRHPGATPRHQLTIGDALYAFARTADYLIGEARSADPQTYKSATKISQVFLDRSSTWPTLTGYGGFNLVDHSVRLAEYGIYAVQYDQFTKVGNTRGKDAVLQSDFDLPSAATIAAPTSITIAVLSAGDSASREIDMEVIAGIEAAAIALNREREDVYMSTNGMRVFAPGQAIANVTILVDVASTAEGVAAAVERVKARATSRRSTLVGVVCSTSSACAAVVPQLVADDVAVFSASATRDSFSSIAEYPGFIRVVRGDAAQAQALVDSVIHFGWSTVAVIWEPGDSYSSGIQSNFADVAAGAGVRVSRTVEVSQDSTSQEIVAGLMSAASADIRIFVLLVTEHTACSVLHVASKMRGQVIGQGFVWVGVDGWVDAPLCLTQAAAMSQQDMVTVSDAIQGSIGTVPAKLRGQESVQWVQRVADTRTQQPSSVVSGDSQLLASLSMWRSHNLGGGGDISENSVRYEGVKAHDLVLILSNTVRRTLEASQNVGRATRLLEEWRNTAGVVGASDVYSFQPSSNSPVSGSYDVLSRRDGNGIMSSSTSTVGTHTDRGFVDVSGCGPGYERLDESAECTPCRPDTFKDTEGNQECTKCPASGALAMLTAGVTGATSLEQCLCPVNTVFDPSKFEGIGTNSILCAECPEGAVCNMVGASYHSLENKAGYWRGDPNATSFEKCRRAESCALSGLTLRSPTIFVASDKSVHAVFVSDWTHSTPCSDGHSGPLCEICVAGFSKDASGNCVQCRNAGLQYVGFIMIILLGLIVVTWIAYNQLPKDKGVLERRRASNVKLFLTFCQINSRLRLMDLIWPPFLDSLYSAQSQGSTVGMPSFAVECTTDSADTSSVSFQMGSVFATPLVMIGFVCAAAGIGVVYKRRLARRQTKGEAPRSSILMFSRRTPTKPPQIWDIWGDYCITWLNVAIFFVYPSIVSTVFTAFDCVAVGGGGSGSSARLYVRTDFKLRCHDDDPRYRHVRLLSVLGIVFYVIGIPVLNGLVLQYNRKSLFHRTGAMHAGRDPEAKLVLGEDSARICQALQKARAQKLVTTRRAHRSRTAERFVENRRQSIIDFVKIADGAPVGRVKFDARVRGVLEAVREIYDKAARLAGLEWSEFYGKNDQVGHHAVQFQARDKLSVQHRQLEVLQVSFEDTVLAICDRSVQYGDCVEYAVSRLKAVSSMQRRYGFMYLQYTTNAPQFELIIMLTKAGLSAIPVLYGSPEQLAQQIAYGCCLVTIVLFVVGKLHPVASPSALQRPLFYATRSARWFRSYVQQWSARRERMNAKKADTHIEDAHVIAAVRSSREGKVHRTIPWTVSIPERFSSRILSELCFAVTIFSLLIGSALSSRTQYSPDSKRSFLSIVLACLAYLINIAGVVVMVATIVSDVYEERKHWKTGMTKAMQTTRKRTKTVSREIGRRTNRAASSMRRPTMAAKPRNQGAVQELSIRNPMAAGGGRQQRVQQLRESSRQRQSSFDKL